MSKSPRPRGSKPLRASRQGGDHRWFFRLYIAGWGMRYEAAHQNLKRLCEEHLGPNCDIEVIDLLEHPHRASADNVIAIPTVIKVSPEPVIRIVGDLSDTGKVLAVLGRTSVTR